MRSYNVFVKRFVVLLGLGLALLAPPSAGASTNAQVSFNQATVTATSVTGESAVVLTIDNASSSPIALTSVTSPVAGMGMIYYDDNMCQSNSVMHWLGNIFITAHSTQKLGYKYDGAMLSLLHGPLKVGQTIELRVKWTNFANSGVVNVRARVVKPPKGLHFDMGNMSMPGMSM